MRTLLMAAALVTLPARAATVPQYDVTYRSEVRGTYAGMVTQRVERGEDGTWVMRQHLDARRLARMMGYRDIDEVSVMELCDGRLRSLSFHSDGARRSDPDIEIHFDYAAGTVTRSHEREMTFAIPSDGLDRGALQIALMQDLAAGGPREVYHVVSGPKVKEMRFHLIEETEITVPAGTFAVQLYERTEDEPDRSTRLWVAPSLDFLPVRMDEIRGGDVRSRLELDSIN